MFPMRPGIGGEIQIVHDVRKRLLDADRRSALEDITADAGRPQIGRDLERSVLFVASRVRLVVGHVGGDAWQGQESAGANHAGCEESFHDRSSARQCVLVDASVFHDELHILVGIGKEVDVRQRIAVDHQNVRERARLDDAELALMGITRAGQRHQLAAAAGCHAQRLRRIEPAHDLGKLSPL